MVALVQALGEQTAIVIGHDWGATVAWHCAMFRPDIFTAVAGLSVPPFGRGPARPLEMLSKQGIDNFYIQYFQKPGVAEAEFERDVEYTFRSAFAGGALQVFLKDGFGFLGDPAIERKLPAWITAGEVAHFVENYRRTGFRGGLNWYRNFDRNWDLTAPWHGAQIRQPSLFLAGSKDGVITGPMGQGRMPRVRRWPDRGRRTSSHRRCSEGETDGGGLNGDFDQPLAFGTNG
jgi:pimeloyl-ACP methyl ester carboxylesterase